MPPKIEELPTVKKEDKPKRNPFASTTKKKTIKRDAREVYGTNERKGLHTPQYRSNLPIDLFFSEVEGKLDGPIENLTIETLDKRFFGAENIQIDNNSDKEFLTRYRVVEKLLDDLIKIQTLSNENYSLPDDKNLIRISLHDIKMFSKLVNLIIIHGIYPALNTFRIGVPFKKRQLNHFADNKKPIVIDKLPSSPDQTTASKKFEYHKKLLAQIYSKLMQIFSTESDVKDLLIKGTGFSDFITVAIALITIPYFDKADKPRYLSDFDNIVTAIPETYELFQIYTLLLTSPSPPYYREFVMTRLQVLHYEAPRKDGLLTLIEFILGLRESDDINIEKFEHVANVVLSKPKSINTMNYFNNIGTQCYDLLIMINRPVVTSCIGYVLEKLWEKNKPVCQDFILKKVWQIFVPKGDQPDGVLVSEAKLNNNINVLISLTKKGLSPDFLSCLFEPIFLSIWTYYAFLKKQSKSAEVISGIIVSYFTVMKDMVDMDDNIYGLDLIAKNILCDDGESWEYRIGSNGLVEIVTKSENDTLKTESKDNRINQFLSNLDSRCESFMCLLDELDDELILKLFINVLKRWLKVNNKGPQVAPEADENPFFMLVDLRLLESIGNKFKESLAKTPLEMLDIVKNILLAQESNKSAESIDKLNLEVETNDSDDVDSDDEDDDSDDQSLPVVLELLSAILSESTPADFDDTCRSMLMEIVKSLKNICTNPSNTQPTIANAAKSLHDRIVLLLDGDKPPISEKDLHTKTLARAITSLNDPLVPIRAHGLYLLRQLVESKSEVISLDFVINLHMIQLKDPEPFIYLNVIKGLQGLIEWDESEVLKLLTKLYINEINDTDLDERLKIGEVLLRYIESANEMFSGESAKVVVESTLMLIRRPLDESDKVDDRLRMSAMSLLGICCKVNPLGILENLNNALDCAIGILQLETDKDSAIMRRSAIVLIHDLIIGTSNTQEVEFPEEYRMKVVNILKYVQETDNDLLVREQAQLVLETIDELVKLALTLVDEGDAYGYLKVT